MIPHTPYPLLPAPARLSRSAALLPNEVLDPTTERVRDLLALRFDEDPDHRLRSGRAHEKPSTFPELAVRALDLRLEPRRERLLAHPDVRLRLREPRHLARERREIPAGLDDGAGEQD